MTDVTNRTQTEHRILLTGGTGQLGTVAVKVLCRHGWQVWVLTRNPASDKAQAVAAVGATLIGGNLNDRDALQAAMSGMDTVSSMGPPRKRCPWWSH